MNTDNILVAIIVLLAVLYTLRHFFKVATGGEKADKCANCALMREAERKNLTTRKTGRPTGV